MAILFWLVIILVCIFAEIHTNAFLAVFIGSGSHRAVLLVARECAFRLAGDFVAGDLGDPRSGPCDLPLCIDFIVEA